MRKLFCFVVVLIVGVSESVFAAREATSTIQGFVASGGVYSFEIWARSTGSTPIRVGTSSFLFNFNSLALGSPTLSSINSKYTGAGGTEEYGPMVVQISTVGSDKYINVTITYNDTNSVGGVGQLLSTDSPDGELICVVHMVVTDGTATAGLSWNTVDSQITNSTGGPVTCTWVGSDLSGPLPIQLASYAANVVRGSDVEVAWKTVSETNNYGFEVYRKRNENGEWKKLGFVEGHGTTLAAHSYTYLDKSVGFGKYYYQIKQIDLDGKSETFPEMNVIVGVAPDEFMLAQNYPNPFNPSTTIEFALPKETHVKLEVYNVLGQRVATLVDETKPAGYYEVTFPANGGSTSGRNGMGLAGGLYFYRLSTNEVSFIKKMLLVK
jgi:hypothetical protein